MSYKNLYQETYDFLMKNYHTLSDIKYIICNGLDVDITEFFKQAQKYSYDSGYGIEEVNTTLMIVGDNWWLERHSYDGAEWWEYKEKPQRPATKGPVKLKEEWL